MLAKRNYLPFEEARAFVHTLELKSWKEWVEYSKSESKPNNIPASPRHSYKAKWVICLLLSLEVNGNILKSYWL